MATLGPNDLKQYALPTYFDAATLSQISLELGYSYEQMLNDVTAGLAMVFEPDSVTAAPFPFGSKKLVACLNESLLPVTKPCNSIRIDCLFSNLNPNSAINTLERMFPFSFATVATSLLTIML